MTVRSGAYDDEAQVKAQTTTERLEGELTSPQVLMQPGPLIDPGLPKRKQQTSAVSRKHREMRKDPTISLARRMSIAPLIAAGWSYESRDDAPEGAEDMIKHMLEPLRMQFVRQALEGCCDHGWAPFETVVGYDEVTGMQPVLKMKALVQDYTDVIVEPDTGAFIGLRQYDQRGWIHMWAEDGQCFAVTLDYEGTDWYGEAQLNDAEASYDAWNDVEQAAKRYDKKVAGTHWVVTYPPGKTPVDGVPMDNLGVAKRIVATLQASGAVAIPRFLTPYADDTSSTADNAWKVELLTDQGQGRAYFIDRQKYLDSLKVRALGIPERALLEGQFGTKAEAEAHADFAITCMEVRYALLVEQLNKYPVDATLVRNYGPQAKCTVAVKPNKLTDDAKSTLKELYLQIMQDPNMSTMEADYIDTGAIRERLQIPSRELPPYDPNAMLVDPSIDPVTGLPIVDPALDPAMPFDPATPMPEYQATAGQV